VVDESAVDELVLLAAADHGAAFELKSECRLPSWDAGWSRGYECGGSERHLGPPIRSSKTASGHVRTAAFRPKRLLRQPGCFEGRFVVWDSDGPGGLAG
jgi:hypothetical protein